MVLPVSVFPAIMTQVYMSQKQNERVSCTCLFLLSTRTQHRRVEHRGGGYLDD